MACYYCHHCGNYKDDDYDVGVEYKGDLICEECAQEVEEAIREDMYDDIRKGIEE